jgi:hypothetical protein
MNFERFKNYDQLKQIQKALIQYTTHYIKGDYTVYQRSHTESI